MKSTRRATGTLIFDLPVINEGTITIAAGPHVTVTRSVTGGVWAGEGTLYVSGGGAELVAGVGGDGHVVRGVDPVAGFVVGVGVVCGSSGFGVGV